MNRLLWFRKQICRALFNSPSRLMVYYALKTFSWVILPPQYGVGIWVIIRLKWTCVYYNVFDIGGWSGLSLPLNLINTAQWFLPCVSHRHNMLMPSLSLICYVALSYFVPAGLCENTIFHWSIRMRICYMELDPSFCFITWVVRTMTLFKVYLIKVKKIIFIWNIVIIF